MVLHQGPAGPRDGLECPVSGVFVPRNVVWVRGTASALSLTDSTVPPAWLSRCAETPALAEEESRQWKRPWRIPTHQLGSGHFGRALELSAMSRVHPLSGSFLPLLLLLSLLKDRGRGAVRREARRVTGTRRRQWCHSQSIPPKLLLPQPFPTSSPLEVDPKLSSPRGKRSQLPQAPPEWPPKAKEGVFQCAAFVWCRVPAASAASTR